MKDKYYTPEQLEKLKQRHETLGQDAIRKAEQDWVEIFEGFREAMENNVDPGAEPVQELVRRSQELIQAFTGGDQGIQNSLQNMYKQEGAANVTAQHGMAIDPKVWDYMSRARQVKTR